MKKKVKGILNSRKYNVLWDTFQGHNLDMTHERKFSDNSWDCLYL